MTRLTPVLLVISLTTSGCALGSASAAYSMRAKTAAELTSEAEDRIVQKSVRATVQFLTARGLIKPTELPVVPPGQSGVESDM